MADSKRDSVRNTLTVAIGVSFVCSILVAATAILLKPVQEKNAEEFRQRIILEVAGLMQPGGDIATLFQAIDSRTVELGNGEMATVYLVRQRDELQQVILPVHGPGLWSTMYGYLALAADGNTVRGLRFYSHAETPGLGDQVDNPDWREQWVGKHVYDANGESRIEVIRGKVQDEESPFEIDGLSGATLTGRGVTQLVRYWTGPQGFGPYLQRLQADGGDTT